MTQQLFDFEGPDVTQVDRKRLTGQILRVFALMKDQVWRSLPEISRATNDPEASVSAQLRHLRKERFGSHTVERRKRTQGLHEYRLTENLTTLIPRGEQ